MINIEMKKTENEEALECKIALQGSHFDLAFEFKSLGEELTKRNPEMAKHFLFGFCEALPKEEVEKTIDTIYKSFDFAKKMKNGNAGEVLNSLLEDLLKKINKEISEDKKDE